MNKTKEKKLNSIKSEMEEIKKYVTTNDSFNTTKQNDKSYLSKETNDTLTLTKIVNEENKIIYNNDLDQIKKQLIELKSSLDENKVILKEILLKIK